METCAAICLEGFALNTNSSSFIVYILAPEEDKCWIGVGGGGGGGWGGVEGGDN